MTPLVKKFNESERRFLLEEYLIRGKQVSEIWERYRGMFSVGRFKGFFSSNLLSDKKLMVDILKKHMSLKEYKEKFIVTSYACLSSKKESYWETEEDLQCQYVNYHNLSLQEKDIFRELEEKSPESEIVLS